MHFCAICGHLWAYRGGFRGGTTLFPFGRDFGGGLLDDEFGGLELEAGGSFVVAEDVPEGLVGLVNQGDGSFAVHQIAFGESLLQGGGEMGELAAPGEDDERKGVRSAKKKFERL